MKKYPPKSDVKERCAECLKAFRRTQFRFKKYSSLLRFPNVCYKCHTKDPSPNISETVLAK